jgi:hypothetical protein
MYPGNSVGFRQLYGAQQQQKNFGMVIKGKNTDRPRSESLVDDLSIG